MIKSYSSLDVNLDGRLTVEITLISHVADFVLVKGQ